MALYSPPTTRTTAAPTRGERDIYTVGRLNREVRQLLEHGMPQLWVEGEVSNFSRPASGHWYFSLKDQDAQVRCAMFRGRNALLRFTPTNGQRVLARVRVGLFESRGEYQLQVEHLEDSGVGALRREYDLLRARLEAEGLFAQALKRPLPTAPSCIGVITSPTGAAIRDILNILARRFPAARVVIYPSAVQGKEAVGQLLEAVATAAARAECEVLIIARGGGSLEDLWAFNDEQLARVIAASPVSVSRNEVPQDIVDKEREIASQSDALKGKPAAAMEGILKGKLNKYFETNCLLEQGFVKNPDLKVLAHLGALGKQLGDEITIRRFLRFQLGEPI